MRRAPTAISLFSGAGGLDIGLEKAGWHVGTATDLMPEAMATLRASAEAGIANESRGQVFLDGTNLLEANVKDLVRSDFRPQGARSSWTPDLLVGGPPCQPWSSAGNQRGLDDPRGQLIAHMLRLIGETQPKFVLFENVRGLVTARGETGTPGEVLVSIQTDLLEMGYRSRIATVNSADFGAGQRRVRLLLIASRLKVLPGFPTPSHSRDPSTGLLPWVSLAEVLKEQGEPDPSDVVRPTGARAPLLEELTPGTGIRTGGQVMANRPGGHWGYRQDAFLADLTIPSRTIRAASTPDWIRPTSGEGMRRLTWRECAALQGFPPEWQFRGSLSSRFQQIGNAVQVNVAEAVGGALIEALRRRPAVPDPMPSWPSELERRVSYTVAENRVNGHLRARARELEADLRSEAS